MWVILLFASLLFCCFRMLLCACDRRRRHVLFGRAAAENDMEAALLAQVRARARCPPAVAVSASCVSALSDCKTVSHTLKSATAHFGM
jgi:hypothetical protein